MSESEAEGNNQNQNQDMDDEIQYAFSFEGIINTSKKMFESEDWAQYIEKVIERTGNIIPNTIITVRHVAVATEQELKEMAEKENKEEPEEE